jgi:nickel-dependent lactate racemase
VAENGRTCSVPFGKAALTGSIPPENWLADVEPGEGLSAAFPAEGLVESALAHPIGSPRLADMVGDGDRVVIVTSDVTRPCPSHRILPSLLSELRAGGVDPGNISVVLALGDHRAHTDDEVRALLGAEVYEAVRCIDSDQKDVVRVGQTPAGTPVDVFRPVAEADLRICVGNVEFHWFAGYSGGYKAIMPGVSTRDAIQANHGMMVRPGAEAGRMDGNPVREDIDQAGELLGVDFILNVVLDSNMEIARAAAGHPIQAHREGCRTVDEYNKVPIPQQADIVVVSPGGYPKDINLYQAQKALDNGLLAVKEGGIVILVAECPDGLGNEVFEEWLLGAGSLDEILRRVRVDFRLGGHKAAAFARAMKRANLYMVSRLPDDLCRRAGFHAFDSLDAALGDAFARMGSSAQVITMPHGASTLPVVVS